MSESTSIIDPSLTLTPELHASLLSALPSMTDEELQEVTRLLEPQKIQYCPHSPTEKQAEFLALDCLEALYGGAAGGGKSDALLMAALQYVHVPGYSAIIFRRTFTDLQLSGALIDRSKSWLMGSDAKWNGEIMTWSFPSGAKLQFGYMASPDDRFRYQGPEYQFVGFDELTHFHEEAYRYMFSRMRRLKSSDVPLRIRSASNPGGVGHDWVKARFITNREPTRRFIPATIQDNPHLDQDSYIESLQNLLPIERERLLEGNWDATDDRIVSYEDMIACTAPCLWDGGRVPANSQPELFIGVDIGRTQDLSVIWTWQRVGDVGWCRNIHVMRGATYSEQKAEMRSRLNSRWVVKCYIDSGGIGNQLAEELHHEFPVTVEGIQLSTGRMGQYGQSLAVACGEKRIRIPDDEELRVDWRKVRKVDSTRDKVRLETDRDKSGHGDRFWAAALGYAAMQDTVPFVEWTMDDLPRAFR